MLRKSVKQIALLLTLVVSIPLTFSACEQKQKEIKLTSNVKQEMKEEDKNASKLVKVKDLDLGDMMYTPVCWKDDENIIVTEGSDKNKNLMDFKSVHIDDINVYNVNIKTSKISKVNTIKDAVCGEIGQKDMYGNFLYIKDNKVCMYNTIENTQKSIYDLSEIIKEQKQKLKIQDNKELLKRIHCGFVLGSDKCIYVMALTSDGTCSMRVINTDTGGVIKGSFTAGYFPNLDNIRGLYSWAYNKNKDSFYVSSIFYNVIYECKLGEKSDIKKNKVAGGEIFDISKDGNTLYLNSIIKKNKKSIIKYDMEKNKAIELINDAVEDKGKNQQSVFENISINYDKSIISYSVQSFMIESDNKNSYKIQATSFIGDFDGKEIKNSRRLPLEQLDKNGNGNAIILNKRGDSFIYLVTYFDYNAKDDVTKLYKTKSYVYQIKK
ncbi:hypothetical protein HBE96_10440 [Clostridium sp. P21]|uniref:Lipoprotein n=1 Tax=Clostridium muellerianum TaxID=2716538 RepID=A0A7Y0HNX8_9CLOT|nr:hypothetical protein [Clostridium muellerianum]NMM63107.1 hypothetical protein [Clostridium muellerianum]